MTSSGIRRQLGPFPTRLAKTDARNGSPEPDLRLTAAQHKPLNCTDTQGDYPHAPAHSDLSVERLCVCHLPLPPLALKGGLNAEIHDAE